MDTKPNTLTETDTPDPMAQFEGNPCYACKDPMTITASNLYPTWSDEFDNLVCDWCAGASSRPNHGAYAPNGVTR
jgi:hypothetical protein